MSTSYGNCFVFNSGKENAISEYVALPGLAHGLSLVINMESEEYGMITRSEGIRYKL